MQYRGRDNRAVWACAIARTTWPFHCQLALWKTNEALFVLLWSEGVKPSEIYKRTKVRYVDSCLSQGRVYGWVEIFQNGRQNVTDEHRNGTPIRVATETVKQQIEKRIRDYTRVTINEIAVEFNMSHGSAHNIVHDDLRCRKVCSTCVPRQLSDDHKHAWQTICQNLDHHAFLYWTVTGDESWVYHFEPEIKRQLTQWKHPLSLANKKIQDTGFCWESCLPSFGMSMALYWCTSRKRVKLFLVFHTVTC